MMFRTIHLVSVGMAALLISSVSSAQIPIGSSVAPPTAVPNGDRAVSAQAGRGQGANEAAVKAVVEAYWSGTPARRWSLLSSSYKADLGRLGITNATQYAKETEPGERVWGRRTYQSVDISRGTRDLTPVAQAILLVGWEEEGYKGVMTFIFDLVSEAGQWRIAYVMH